MNGTTNNAVNENVGNVECRIQIISITHRINVYGDTRENSRPRNGTEMAMPSVHSHKNGGHTSDTWPQQIKNLKNENKIQYLARRYRLN